MINVFFHLLNNTDGTNSTGQSWGLPQIMNAVRALNVTYNPHNIFFKYIGYDVTNNDALTNHQISYPASLYNPEAFNIFFANAASTYSAYAIRGNTKSVFSYGALNGPYFDFTICHEIGHCLNLLHTFQNAGAAGCEHVTRNPADPNYNATTAGDQVADTPAQPQLGWSNFTDAITTTILPIPIAKAPRIRVLSEAM